MPSIGIRTLRERIKRLEPPREENRIIIRTTDLRDPEELRQVLQNLKEDIRLLRAIIHKIVTADPINPYSGRMFTVFDQGRLIVPDSEITASLRELPEK